MIGASARSSIVIGYGGAITVFGFNKDGLLGLTDKIVLTPFTTTLEIPIQVHRLSCGFKHVAFLDGTSKIVFASGSNKRG